MEGRNPADQSGLLYGDRIATHGADNPRIEPGFEFNNAVEEAEAAFEKKPWKNYSGKKTSRIFRRRTNRE